MGMASDCLLGLVVISYPIFHLANLTFTAKLRRQTLDQNIQINELNWTVSEIVPVEKDNMRS